MSDQGYVVIEDIISVEVRAAMLNNAKKIKFEKLFNDNIMSIDIPTGRQLGVLTTSPDEVTANVLETISSKLGKLGILTASHGVDTLAYIRNTSTDAGKKLQAMHTDFDPECGKVEVNFRPFSILFSLMEYSPAYLWLIPYTSNTAIRVHVEAGSVVAFFGDVKHFGDGYDSKHTRFHIYFGVKNLIDNVGVSPQNKAYTV